VLFQKPIYFIVGFDLYIHEIISVLTILFTMPILFFYFNKNRNKSIEFSIILFIGVSILSSLLNSYSSVFQSTLGVFYLLKAPLFIYVIIKLGITKKIINLTFKILLYYSLCSVVFQFLQIIVPNISILTSGFIESGTAHSNFSRASGLLGSANQTAQLYIVTYLVSRILGRKMISLVHLFLFLGILLTVSNLGVIVFGIVLTLEIVFVQRKVFLLIPVSFILLIVIFSYGQSFLFRFGQMYDLIIINQTYFRIEAYKQMLLILSNYPYFGLGPGYYGGSVAAIFGSEYHNEYHTFDYFYNSINKPKTLDAFFPHLISEIGLLGTLVYLNIYNKFFKLLNFHKNMKGRENFILLKILILIFLFSGISMLIIENEFGSIFTMLIGMAFLKSHENIDKRITNA